MNNNLSNSKLLAYSAAAGAALAIAPNAFSNHYTVFKAQKTKLVGLMDLVSNNIPQIHSIGNTSDV